MVGGPYDALKQACYGAQRDRLLSVQYETLTTDPAKTMHAIYAFLGEPVFEHDFGHVDYDVTEFDERAGTPGLHTVRPMVKAEPRESLLPPDLFKRVVNDAFWRDPQRIPPGCRSCEVFVCAHPSSGSPMSRAGPSQRRNGKRGTRPQLAGFRLCRYPIAPGGHADSDTLKVLEWLVRQRSALTPPTHPSPVRRSAPEPRRSRRRCRAAARDRRDSAARAAGRRVTCVRSQRFPAPRRPAR